MALPYRWQWRIERWKNALRGMFGGGEREAARPRLCPACGTLVGTKATRCHECGTSLNFSLTAAGKAVGSLFGGEAPVTRVLLVINILMFGISLLATAKVAGGLNLLGDMNGQVLSRMGASRIDRILSGEWFRLVTAMFLHGGLIHIGFNMMVLMDLGPQLEEVYGSPRFLFFYTTTGMFSFVVSALLGHFAVGASGALMGLAGLMIAITTRRGGAYMKMLRGRLLAWVASIFVIGFLLPGVDNAAHFGGLAAGFGLGKIFADREPMNSAERNRAYALGWIAGITVVASLVMVVVKNIRPQ